MCLRTGKLLRIRLYQIELYFFARISSFGCSYCGRGHLIKFASSANVENDVFTFFDRQLIVSDKLCATDAE